MPALLYWAVVFALGFILGTLRTLWLVPQLGEFSAVACELPIMLGASWLWARRLIAKFRISPGWRALRMGVAAFAMLVLGEMVLGIFAFGLTPAQWLEALAKPPGALGLLGQVVFATLPWLAARRPN